MKKLFTLFIIGLTVNMYAQNYVPNADFEGGETGWTNSGAVSRTLVQPGNNASVNAFEVEAEINKGAQYKDVGVAMVVGTHELSFWAKGTAGEVARFKVKFTDASTETVSGTFANSDTWELFQTSFELTAEKTIDKFLLQAGSGTTAAPMTFVSDDLFCGIRATYSLTKTITGVGKIIPASDALPQNTEQTITAVPNLGYEFAGWGGDLSGTTNPTTLTMDGDKSISATFTKIPGFAFEWNFNTDDDLEGWTAYTNSSIVVANGVAEMTMTGNWPRFRRDDMGVTAADYDIFEIRLKNNTIYDVASETPLKFVFVDGEGAQKSNVIPNTTASDTEFKTYRVLLGGHDSWNGTIESFLIMGPTKLTNPQSAGTVEIDYIKLLKGNAVATLNSLTAATYSLSPAFSPDVHDYTLTVPAGTQTVNFSAVATESDKATVTIRQITQVNGVDVATDLVDGIADVSSGSAKVSIKVEAENGAKQFYVIMITDDTATSIEDAVTANVRLFPNPVKQELNISADGQVQKVELYSLTGQKVLSKVANVNKIEVSNLPKGIYIALITIDGQLVQKKITKQ